MEDVSTQPVQHPVSSMQSGLDAYRARLAAMSAEERTTFLADQRAKSNQKKSKKSDERTRAIVNQVVSEKIKEFLSAQKVNPEPIGHTHIYLGNRHDGVGYNRTHSNRTNLLSTPVVRYAPRVTRRIYGQSYPSSDTDDYNSSE